MGFTKRLSGPGVGRYATALLAIGVGLVLLIAGPAMGASFRVRATGDDTWRPGIREIEREDKIVWRNPTESFHDVKAYGGNWNYYRTLESGEGVSRRFNTRGTFKYRCTIHSKLEKGNCVGMCGKIRVVRPE